MVNKTLNFEAGNGNWWWRCNHKRKALIGSEHTFHWLHWHTSCSFSGKNGWKLWGNYVIWFGFFDNGLWRELMVSLVIFSESLDNLCSSKSDVRLRFWSWYDLKKLLWPSWTQHSGLLCLWQCLEISFLPWTSLHTAAWHKGRQSGAIKSHFPTMRGKYVSIDN